MGFERILIIEDDSGIQEMLKHAFAREGWNIIPASCLRIKTYAVRINRTKT